MSVNTSKQQENLTDPMSYLISPVSNQIAILEFFAAILFNIIRASCVPAELIFRRGFGERHFNLWLYISGSMWLFMFTTGWINIPKLFGYFDEGWMPNFAIFSVVGMIFFGSLLWQLFLRKFRKINAELHSRYDGDPLPFLYKLPFAKDRNQNPKEYFVRQVYEPLFLLILGVIVSIALNPQTGSWLLISGLGMAVKEYVKSRYVRNALLDHIDADIAARNIKSVLKGAPPSQTQGIYIAGLPNEGKKRDKLKGLFGDQKPLV